MSHVQIFFLATLPIALFFGFALSFATIRWAHLFRWPLPPAGSENRDERNLTLYFGRCVGALGLAFAVGAIAAIIQPSAARPLLWFTVALGAALTAVHVYGALKRAQPASETWEILMYGGLTIWGSVLLLQSS